MNLFLLGNMVCCCCFLPVLAGVWDNPLGRKLVTESVTLPSFPLNLNLKELALAALACRQ